MLTGPDGGAAASAPRRRIKCCRQCAGLGWTFLLKNKNGPELRRWLWFAWVRWLQEENAGRKKTGRYLCRRIISTECNDTVIGNNILLLNDEFKELVHEHLALFIYLFMFRGPWACTWAGFMWEPSFQLIMGFAIGPSSVGRILSTSGKCVPYEK